MHSLLYYFKCAHEHKQAHIGTHTLILTYIFPSRLPALGLADWSYVPLPPMPIGVASPASLPLSVAPALGATALSVSLALDHQLEVSEDGQEATATATGEITTMTTLTPTTTMSGGKLLPLKRKGAADAVGDLDEEQDREGVESAVSTSRENASTRTLGDDHSATLPCGQLGRRLENVVTVNQGRRRPEGACTTDIARQHQAAVDDRGHEHVVGVAVEELEDGEIVEETEGNAGSSGEAGHARELVSSDAGSFAKPALEHSVASMMQQIDQVRL